MSPPRRNVLIALAVAAFGGFAGLACQASHARPNGGSAGVAGRDAAAGAGSGVAPDGGERDGIAADAPLASCPKAPPPLRSGGATLALSFAPVLEGKPFVFGEPNALSSGAEVTPLNFRFYVSHVALLTAAGASVPVDLVSASGALEPYDVHLFNAEEPTSQVLRVLAPAGTYVGLSFTLGLDDACDSGAPGDREPPLTDTSQLTWPHTQGYLFLRLETQVDTSADAGHDGGAPAIPPAIHMGGTPGRLLAPRITVTGGLALSTGAPTTRTVTVDVGALFAGAEADGDPATLATVLPFPEVLAGERLREHASGLTLFVLAP